MIRSSKKMKLNDVSKSDCIKSGNFMTSYLHDQTEYTVILNIQKTKF